MLNTLSTKIKLEFKLNAFSSIIANFAPLEIASEANLFPLKLSPFKAKIFIFSRIKVLTSMISCPQRLSLTQNYCFLQ